MASKTLMNLRNRLLTEARDAFDLVFNTFNRRTHILFVVTDGCGFACQAPVIRALLQYPEISVHTTSEENRMPCNNALQY